MDDRKVVSLRGEPVLARCEVREQVVELCRELLALAESGDLTGVAISLQHRDGSFSPWYGGDYSLGTVGNLERLQLAMIEDLGTP